MLRHVWLLLLIACDKPEAPKPAPDPVPAASATPAVASVAPPSATVSAAPAVASASASASPSATTASAAPKKDAAGPALKAASGHLDGNHFSIDLASPGCKKGEECAATIKLTAAAAYHINKEYPYRFVPADPASFGFVAAEQKRDSEKTATMTVRFKPTAAGDAKVEGTYKMSICSDEQCQIEQPKLSLTVPVI